MSSFDSNWLKTAARLALILPAIAGLSWAQQQYSAPKERIKYVREVAKQANAGAIAQIAPYLKDPDIDVRIEAARGIASIGTPACLDPLTRALADIDPEVQNHAINGLVNFYIPGFLQTGFTGSIKRAGGAIKQRFAGDDNNPLVPAYVDVRPAVIQGLAGVLSNGASMEAKANAARALGMLRGRAALPQLTAALHAGNSDVIYESLIAIEEINDPSAAPAAVFLLHDLVDKVQIAALDTQGLLRNRAALPDLRDVYAHPRNKKMRMAALNAIAQMPEPQDHELFSAALANKDAAIRAAAAEGIGRLKNPADRQMVKNAFDQEPKEEARMAFAFAEVMLGNRDTSEFAPLRYLVNELNSAAWKGVTLAYLIELARQQPVREALYPLLRGANSDEKMGLAQVLSTSGDAASIPYLDKLSRDSDPDVARAGLDAFRSLKTRYPQP